MADFFLLWKNEPEVSYQKSASLTVLAALNV